MTDPTWRDELVDEAKKWPASFRAELSAGHWRLQGANEDVYRSLKVCAERFVLEIHHPDSDAEPIDVLLDHLYECRKPVRLGSMPGSSRPPAASIPLRDALIEYLNTKKDAGAQNKGDAAVTKKNREIRVRHQIVEAFQRLGTPMREWPDFVNTFYTEPEERAGYCDPLEPSVVPTPGVRSAKRISTGVGESGRRCLATTSRPFSGAVPVLGHHRGGRGNPISRNAHAVLAG